MKFLVLCFSMLSIGLPLNASNVESLNVFKTSDRRFDKYKRRFEYYHKVYTGKPITTSNIPINLVNDPYKYCTINSTCSKNIVGLCLTRRTGEYEILIKRKSFYSYTESDVEQLIFHELGHCALNLDHRRMRYNNKPISLMSTKMFSDTSFYDKNKKGLLSELFTGNLDILIKGLFNESN